MAVRLSVVVVVAMAVVMAAQQAAAQKLTGNLTGSTGVSCIPTAVGIGTDEGCNKGEGCCPTTNTCVKRDSCGAFMLACPPPSCGKSTSFVDAECPAEATKLFKSPKGLKCQESSDALCLTNGTAMVLTCKNGAGAGAAARSLVAVLAAAAALVCVLLF